ncbi:unnamed protein product [Lymnaea stagnalis]|uniref:Sulfotransferase domain-containing protein n=1 Tax=Lymnaea stagnalis TaxID=6523 RepID=A0AAV2HWN3_LYMST
MAACGDGQGFARSVFTRSSPHHRLLLPRRPHNNQSLLTAFAAICGFVVMVTFLETSRMLIPSKVVTKQDLQLLTSGFSKDIAAVEKSAADKVHSQPHSHRPGVMVVGFSHCGGNVIMSALSAHPHLAVNLKNLGFFTNDKPLRWYIAQMPPSLDHHVTVDVSFSAVLNKTALKRMRSFNETLKLLVFTCDPISRLVENHTDYLRHRGHALTQLLDHKLAESLAARVFPKIDGKHFLNTELLSQIGDYFQHFIELFQVFPRRQILVVDRQRFYDNPGFETSRLHDFLGVSRYAEIQDLTFDRGENRFCYNITFWKRLCVRGPSRNASEILGPRHADLLGKLRSFYAPFNKRLFLYLEEDFKWL